MQAELRCQVYPGQFSSEFTVVVEEFQGRRYSLFASRDEVRVGQDPTQDAPAEGWLRVQVIGDEGNNVLVQLPHSTIENGPYLAVRRDQIRFTPVAASA
jgi:hypothetical protein